MSIHLAALNTRLKLSGVVVARTPLHVGAGRSMGATGSDLPTMCDLHGSPIIPGSSLKGVLRSQIEALLRPLGRPPGEALSFCDVVAEKPCIDKRDWGKCADWIVENACSVCLLFGGPCTGARLRVTDLPVRQETWDPLLIQVRDGVAIDRESLTAAGSMKYDLETVPAGVAFDLQIVLENAEDWEVGLVLRGLDLLTEGYATLGGGGSRGLGRVTVDVQQIESIDARTVLTRGPAGGTVVDLEGRARYYAALAEAVESASALEGCHVQ